MNYPYKECLKNKKFFCGLEKSVEKNKKKLFLRKFLSLFVLMCLPSLCWADSDQDMLSSVLSGFIDLLTSTPARLLFVVAIIGVGYGTLVLGKVPKERAVAIVIGIGIVFSASYIAQKMGLGG